MKKAIIIVISVLAVVSVALLAVNYLCPYYVHLSATRYAEELEEKRVEKGSITLCSKITRDENVNSNYISFYIVDNASKAVCFECSEGWRIRDFKYLGFEKGTDNVLAISADTGTYRYVKDGNSWREETVSEGQDPVPDSKYFVVNNLSTE